jgi:putative transposase
MPRPHRFTEKQIVLALHEVEAGSASPQEVCDRMGVNERTFYKWRAKFGGLEADEVARLRQLEDENRRLKHAVAELTLDNQALKAIVKKKF